MKKTCLFFLLFNSLFIFAQNKGVKNEDIALYQQGTAVYEITIEFSDENFYVSPDTIISTKTKAFILENTQTVILKRSLSYFEDMVKYYPKSKLIFIATYNIGEINYHLNNYDIAKENFLKILDSKAKDKDLSKISNIVAEPYTNYKNKACKLIAEIEYQNGNFAQAINYMILSKEYPYRHFCGNALASDKIFVASNIAKNYLALGDRKSALSYLLPYIVENGIANNINLVQTASAVFIEEFGNDNAQIEFNAVISTLKSRDVYFNKQKYISYTVNFNGREIDMDLPWRLDLNSEDPQTEEFALLLKNSEFNKLLNK